jgi:hypothetical protein
VNGPRNLLQICCLLDDSTAIIKWSAMAKSRADNGELGCRVERRFGQGSTIASKMFSTSPSAWFATSGTVAHN